MSILQDIKNVVRALSARQRQLADRISKSERTAIILGTTVEASNPHPESFTYTTVTYKYADGTVAMVSTLSMFDSATQLFTRRTEQYYNSVTAALERTVVYQIEYDDYRLPKKETQLSVTFA